MGLGPTFGLRMEALDPLNLAKGDIPKLFIAQLIRHVILLAYMVFALNVDNQCERNVIKAKRR